MPQPLSYLEDEREIPSQLLRGKGRGKMRAQNDASNGYSCQAEPGELLGEIPSEEASPNT